MTPAKPEVVFSARSVHQKTGQVGAHMLVSIKGKYPKSYPVHTHGMTAQQAVAHIRDLETRHARKELRIDELQASVGIEFTVGQSRLRITDAVIRERGASDMELLVLISRLVGTEWRRAGSVSRVYPTVDAIPDVVGVELLAREFIEGEVAKEVQHEEFAAQVAALLGG